MNLCRWVMLSPFHMFRNTRTENLVSFHNSFPYVRNVYVPSSDNAADLSKEICGEIDVFAHLFHFAQLS